MKKALEPAKKNMVSIEGRKAAHQGSTKKVKGDSGEKGAKGNAGDDDDVDILNMNKKPKKTHRLSRKKRRRMAMLKAMEMSQRRRRDGCRTGAEKQDAIARSAKRKVREEENVGNGTGAEVEAPGLADEFRERKKKRKKSKLGSGLLIAKHVTPRRHRC